MPLKVSFRNIKNIDIAKISIVDIRIRFIISERLRQEFDLQHVTGIKYEELEDEQKSRTDTKIYVAEIIPSVAQTANDIELSDYCSTHRIILTFILRDIRTPRANVGVEDFQMIDRVIVKGTEYYYAGPDFMISRKVLNILLKQKIKELYACCF